MDSSEWDKRYAGSELIWGAPPNTVVVEQLWAIGPGRAVDLACGEGRHAIWLAERGWRVTALDFSQVAIDKGATVATRSPRVVRERIEWARSDVTAFDGTGYDLVLMAYLQLPAAQRRTVLRRGAAALNPGGVLLVLGHDSTNISGGYGGPQDPDVLFTPDDVVADLQGLLDVRVAERRLRPTEGGDAIDALVVALSPVRSNDATRAPQGRGSRPPG